MMGGSTKIGIGRTTRVKAVSMIAWGKIGEHCAHASFQTWQQTRVHSVFHEIRWLNDLQESSSKPHVFGSHHIYKSQIKTFSALNLHVPSMKKGSSRVLQQFWRIPLHSRCCPVHQYLQIAHCVSSSPRYRCWQLLQTRGKVFSF